MRGAASIAVLLAFAFLEGACGPREVAPGSAPPDPEGAALARLRDFEESRRASADFAHLPTSDRLTGPDPYALRPVPSAGAQRFVGVLRGRDAIVLLDESLHELARLPAPASPTGLAVTPKGEVFVTGEASDRVARFRVVGDRLEPAGGIDLGGAATGRDVARGPEGVLYVVDQPEGTLITLELDESQPSLRVRRRTDVRVGLGPIHVQRVGDRVLVDCLLEHTIVVHRVDPAGNPALAAEARIRHDGPIWSFDAAADGAGLLVATGGAEDHALDRTGGSFGYVDSFVHLYRVEGAEPPRRLAEVNVSALGVVTPKWLAIATRGGAESALELRVTGYGGDRSAVLRFGGALTEPPEIVTVGLPPGTTSGALSPDGSLVLADPLLDAWLRLDAAGKVSVVGVEESPGAPAPRMSTASRVGEALFFTTLMAPWNLSEGELSRFTCETCHFEGYVDGRTHHTGRGEVRATTKPLLGLFNNRPHFSRALDPDLTAVAHNEFRVAGARSGRSPWFTATVAEFPWLARLGVEDSALSPEQLRRSLMSFLMDFTHRPNPRVLARLRGAGPGAAPPSLGPRERRGAELFRDRCERCHASRLVADDAASRVPFERWEASVLALEGALVWGRDGYERTGVEPYVHDEGARVPSLRRLHAKRPYFTNGEAKTLDDVLARVREAPQGFFHAGGPEEQGRLSERERAELLAFLELL